MSQLHDKIDKLERYVNTRDNLLALRIDGLDNAAADDGGGDRRERASRDIDDWKPLRRH